MGGPAGIEPNDYTDMQSFCAECGGVTYQKTYCLECDKKIEAEEQAERESDLQAEQWRTK